MDKIRRALPALLVLALAAPILASAAISIENPLGQGATFDRIIQNIVKFVQTIIAPLATLMILIAGFLYMTAGGSPEKIKKAHQTLIWALVGIGIVLLASSAAAIIQSIING